MEFGKEYIKTFDTEAQYLAFKASSGYNEPNVSYISGDSTVHYNKYDPYNGHDYVDLGLPSGTKWATMNIGASSVTDYGNYYQYGKGADQYAATSGDSNYSGTENPLATSADTVAQTWGGNWHMPTSAQCAELTANTTYEWTTINGVNGGKFTASNGNYVFFPAAGTYGNGSQYGVGSDGLYWSSTPSDSYNAYYLYFNDGSEDVNSYGRKRGFSVRGVVG